MPQKKKKIYKISNQISIMCLFLIYFSIMGSSYILTDLFLFNMDHSWVRLTLLIYPFLMALLNIEIEECEHNA